MVRVVPLFVVVMLATIAMIVLVSSIVMGMKFLFSNKRQTFGILLAGFVLAIISCVVLSGAFMLNRRYERAEYHARLHHEFDRSQAVLNRQIQSDLQRHGVEIHEVVVESPMPPEPVSSLSRSSLAVSLEKEHAAEAVQKQMTESAETTDVETEAEKNIDQERPAQVNDSTSTDTVDAANATLDEPAHDQTIPSELAEQPSAVESVSRVAVNLKELDSSIASVLGESPAIHSEKVKNSTPDWLQQGESLTEWQGVTAKVVTSAKPDPRLLRLEIKLKTRSACIDQAMQIQEELGLSVSSEPDVTDEMMAACQRESYTVAQPLPGGGFQNSVHQLLVFDEDFRVYVQDAVRDKEITQRLQTTTILSGIVLSSVTFLYGTFSFLAYWRRPKTA